VSDGPEPVFFLDRNLGRKTVPTELRKNGFLVEVMDDHFTADTPDEVWLEAVGKRGWFVVTQDQKIRYRQREQEAVQHFEVGLFVLLHWKGSTGSGDRRGACQGEEGAHPDGDPPAPAVHREGLRRWPGDPVAHLRRAVRHGPADAVQFQRRGAKSASSSGSWSPTICNWGDDE